MNTKTKTKTKTEQRKLVALMMTNSTVKDIERLGKERHRSRSGQLRAMVDWLLTNRKVLNDI